jgi:hypothetical protein
MINLPSPILPVSNCKIMSDLILSISPNLSLEFLLSHYFDDIVADIKCQYTDVYDQGVIVRLVSEAYATADLDLNIEAAIKFGNGFRYPAICHTHDASDLAAVHGDLEALIQSRQSQMSANRLNISNVDNLDILLPGDADCALLRTLVNGIPVVLDPDFIADPVPPKPSPIYLQAASAVDLSWYELYLKGFVLLIPTRILKYWHDRRGFSLSYSRAGWAKKRGKPQGRPTTNLSYDNHRGGLINTDTVRDSIRGIYGHIHPAQLDHIVTMIHRQASVHGWENIILWKMDLLGAYNLVFFKASDAGLLAMEMSDNLTLISMVGHFGWVGTPFAFDVISRLIVKLVNRSAKGEAVIATDDLIGCCATIDLEFDLGVANKCIHSIFNADCVNEAKTVFGRIIEAIGWAFNLDEMWVGIARHNFLKTLHGFLRIRSETHLSVKQFMTLASWASRYVTIVRFMKPFNSYLHSLTAGKTNLNSMLLIDSQARQICNLWVSFLMLMEIKPMLFTRTFNQFTSMAPTIHINVDASLTGIGIIISQMNGDNSLSVIAVTGFHTAYNLEGDSSYQNSMEFIAVTCALALCVRLGMHSIGISLQGDNQTALSWSKSEKFKSARAMRAACFFICLSTNRRIEIAEKEHLAGYLNVLSDGLSRGASPASLGFADHLVVDFLSCPVTREILAFMNPTTVMESNDNCVSMLFSSARNLADLLSVLYEPVE